MPLGSAGGVGVASADPLPQAGGGGAAVAVVGVVGPGSDRPTTTVVGEVAESERGDVVEVDEVVGAMAASGSSSAIIATTVPAVISKPTRNVVAPKRDRSRGGALLKG